MYLTDLLAEYIPRHFLTHHMPAYPKPLDWVHHRVEGSPKLFPGFVEEWLANFDAAPVAEWTYENDWVAGFTVIVYLIVVFGGQAWMKNRAPMKATWPVYWWNLFLALFSTFGFWRSAGYYFPKTLEDGFVTSITKDARHSDYEFFHGDLGFWMICFQLSKIPEMFDTVLLVLKKKDVILLHWWHHISVMLYCWYIIRTGYAGGRYFNMMNYGVHSIMYSYYFFMSFSPKTRKIIGFLNIYITTLQILQMVGGLFVLSAAMYLDYIVDYCGTNKIALAEKVKHHDMLHDCQLPTEYLLPGFLMYLSYFVLFSKLFYESYILKKKKKAAGASTPAVDKKKK